MMSKRRIFTIINLTLIIVLLSMVGAWVSFLHTSVVDVDQGVKFKVVPGATIKTVSADLYNLHIIQNRLFFNLLIRYRKDSHNLKAGEYLFPKGSTPPKILDQMIEGSGMVYHAFTIVPGWNFQQLRDAMQKNDEMRHTIQKLSNAEVMAHLGHADLQPEGQFFPDTYFFVEGASDVSVLKRSFHAMQDKLNMAWKYRVMGLPFQTPYEALIAASIIEKEAFLDSERPVIAGVMVNRLRSNMLLQFDPTVIYGMGNRYAGALRRIHLTENTPYNTYIHKGLPPTPISMPSLGSIQAVLHPKQHQYYYFVARGDGTHQFSKSLAEHSNAIQGFKVHQPWFFNSALVREYVLKLMFEEIFRVG